MFDLTSRYLGRYAAGRHPTTKTPGCPPSGAQIQLDLPDIWPSGPTLSPTLISEFSLVAQRPARRPTQDMAWLTSAISAGTAAGPAAAGEVIDAAGGR